MTMFVVVHAGDAGHRPQVGVGGAGAVCRGPAEDEQRQGENHQIAQERAPVALICMGHDRPSFRFRFLDLPENPPIHRVGRLSVLIIRKTSNKSLW